MDTNQLLLALCALILGVAGKYLDLFNNQQIKEPFKGAGMLAGYIWGFSGMGMTLASHTGSLLYVALTLYWVLRAQIYYPNQTIARVIMLLGAFFCSGRFLQSHRWELVTALLAYLVADYLQTLLKTKYPTSWWRFRSQFYLIPIVYAIYADNSNPLIAAGCCMFSYDWLTIRLLAYFEKRKRRLNDEFVAQPKATNSSLKLD